MANYCTAEDIILSALERGYADDLEAREPGCTARIIEEASVLMDNYIGNRYLLPITDTESLKSLRGCCVAISRYKLLGRLNMAGAAEDVKADWEFYTRSWLVQLANGTLTLPTEEGERQEGDLDVTVVTRTRGNGKGLFTARTLRGFACPPS